MICLFLKRFVFIGDDDEEQKIASVEKSVFWQIVHK